MGTITNTEVHRLLNLRQVMDRTTLSRASLYRMVAEGQFPKQIALSPRRVAWPSTVVDQWIADRVAGA